MAGLCACPISVRRHIRRDGLERPQGFTYVGTYPGHLPLKPEQGCSEHCVCCSRCATVSSVRAQDSYDSCSCCTFAVDCPDQVLSCRFIRQCQVPAVVTEMTVVHVCEVQMRGMVRECGPACACWTNRRCTASSTHAGVQEALVLVRTIKVRHRADGSGC
jgi:hypothetical protein